MNRALQSGSALPVNMPGIAILGAGMSGIAMGIALKKAGFHSFTIFEKAAGIGGTWWDNTYPGAQCDVRSHLYSYSFEPNPDWSRTFAPQAEIQHYMAHCAEKYDLMPHIRLNCAITQARFDADSASWTLRTQRGESVSASIFICSAAPLCEPRYPDVPGLATFSGKLFHSSRWDHGFDLREKRVAVIGNAASAVQIVPRIAPVVRQFTVFQRSAHWILPRPDRAYTALEKTLFRVPPIACAHRYFLYWLHESNRLGFNQGSRVARYATRMAEKHLAHQVPDEQLRAVLRPDYPIGCKRVLISSDYYPALTRPNAELATSPIERVTADGIVTRDGRVRAVDAIICATGFDAVRLLSSVHITGPAGNTLAMAWREAPEAYHGVSVAGFPNFFLLLGPNTGQGHTSTLIFIEAQVEFAMCCMRELLLRGKACLDVKPEAMRLHNHALQETLGRSVWAAGCASWYKTSAGRIAAIYPGFSFQYVRELRRAPFADYAFF